jgi:CcmD family protein
MIENTLIVVLVIVLVIWLGLAYYIFRMERHLKRIEKVVETAKIDNE